MCLQRLKKFQKDQNPILYFMGITEKPQSKNFLISFSIPYKKNLFRLLPFGIKVEILNHSNSESTKVARLLIPKLIRIELIALVGENEINYETLAHSDIFFK